eukprot:TRINITY_DN50912_c0_g1_i1.p1 TRINITY_DN50912_c0_g1~~TRINITY_DN50912_c0_g1_i1.p1  ORF type:complete len:116 (-),score=23.66 TRINITY_DN50912_c0_g1_i1:66-413(-)
MSSKPAGGDAKGDEGGAAAAGGKNLGEEPTEEGWIKYLCFGLLDIIAAVFRGCIAVARPIVYCLGVGCYATKETFYDLMDAWEVCLRPWKKRAPATDVPLFKYDATSTRHGDSKV